MCEMKGERRRVAVAEGERCGRLTGVGEAVQVAEMQRAVADKPKITYPRSPPVSAGRTKDGG